MVVIGDLFVVRGSYWSFVCCERSLLVICLLCEVVIGDLFVVRGSYW